MKNLNRPFFCMGHSRTGYFRCQKSPQDENHHPNLYRERHDLRPLGSIFATINFHTINVSTFLWYLTYYSEACATFPRLSEMTKHRPYHRMLLFILFQYGHLFWASRNYHPLRKSALDRNAHTKFSHLRSHPGSCKLWLQAQSKRKFDHHLS